jgi:DNA-binding LacI/PurR family transcriptional regulator
MPRPAPHRPRNETDGRPRIAFLAAYLNDEYEWAIWRGVRGAVEARGGSVACIAGAGLRDPSAERQARSALFDLVDAAVFDGILCLSSVLGHYAGVQGTEAWLLKRGLLACSIGPGEHVPSVSVDDGAGIEQLMRHLIEHHGHRRIVFIGGTPVNAEATRRLAGYERALRAHDIALDPRLVVFGDFSPESGGRAVAELFDRRQVGAGDFDAIVASNDYMAIAAIEELTRRRIAVPEQVAVVGFDDIAPARFNQPTLTTVRQPLEQLGRDGADRLLDLLDGQAQEGARTLETELVLRRSCGCIPTDVPPALAVHPELEETTMPGNAALGASLEAALGAELHGGSGAFARALEPYLRRAAAGDAKKLDQGRHFADELAARVRLANDDLVHERLGRLARVLHTRMFGPQAHLSTTLAELLPDFGLDECVVSEFVEGEPGAARPALKLSFGFDAKTLQPQMATFDARELVPSRFEHLRTRSALVLPLTSGERMVGVAVLPASDRDGAFYETIAQLFGTVLKVLELRRRAGR